MKVVNKQHTNFSKQKSLWGIQPRRKSTKRNKRLTPLSTAVVPEP